MKRLWQVRVFRWTRKPVMPYRRPHWISPVLSDVKQPVLDRIQLYHRSFRWSVMRQLQRHRLQKSRIKYQVFLYRRLSLLQCLLWSYGCWQVRVWALRWQEVFQCWLSAARVLLDLRHRWLLWWAMAWVPGMVFFLRRRYPWKRQARYRLSLWIRRAPSPMVNLL